MASKPTTAFQELCYGIPVEVIAEWCCVNLTSARQFKSGTRFPSRPSLKLFSLHLEERIVPPEWQGFTFRGGRMYDPSGKEFTHGLLRAYHAALQLLCEWARSDGERSRTVNDLLRQVPREQLSAQRAQQLLLARRNFTDALSDKALKALEDAIAS